jgi:hypothetical protein
MQWVASATPTPPPDAEDPLAVSVLCSSSAICRKDTTQLILQAICLAEFGLVCFNI